jgi:AcrR family transcriptional regulator
LGRPRTKAPEVRRDELMNAAERLFLERGVAATSVDHIVSATGIAKGTFYLYFTSKESLLAAVQERFVTMFCEAAERAMDQHRAGQWRPRLRAFVKAAVDGYLDHVALHDVLFHEYRPQDRRQMSDNAAVDQLAGLLAAGAEAKAWVAEDPQLTAIMLFHSLHGAVDAALVKGGPVDRPRLVRTLTRFFERALSENQ